MTVINPPVARRIARQKGVDWHDLCGPEHEQAHIEWLEERVDKESGRRRRRVTFLKFCREFRRALRIG